MGIEVVRMCTSCRSQENLWFFMALQWLLSSNGCDGFSSWLPATGRTCLNSVVTLQCSNIMIARPKDLPSGYD